MTVAAEPVEVTYAGNGTQTVFAIPFRYLEQSDLHVSLLNGDIEEEQHGNFLIDDDNSTIIYPYPPLSIPNLQAGYSIKIKRIEPITQTIDLVNQGNVSVEDIELAIDKLTMISQQLKSDLTGIALTSVGSIADGSITTNKLDELAVTANKIAKLTITAAEIADASITGAKIGTATITGANIATATINAGNIENGSITAIKIHAGTITANEIANAAITGDKIGTGVILASNIATGAITANEIAVGAITGELIATGAITTTNIQVGAITADQIENLTITTNKIGLLQITDALIASISADKISSGLINVSRLNINGIIMQGFTWTDVSPGAGSIAWSSGTLVYGGMTYAIDAGNSTKKYIFWQSGTLSYAFQGSDTFPTLGDGDFLIATNVAGAHDLAWGNSASNESVVTTSIAGQAVTAAKIANATITATQIANATITATQIANATITSTQLANATITASKIAALTITANEIANLTITSGKIASISADKITTGTLDASLVTISSTDGKMTLSGNIFQVKDGSNVIQLTLGKYDGTNYGLAIGSNPASPTIAMTANAINVNTYSSLNCKSNSDIKFYTTDNSYHVSLNCEAITGEGAWKIKETDGGTMIAEIGRTSGRMRLSKQPEGSWYLLNGSANKDNVTGDGTAYTIPFDTVLASNNMGSSFDTTTGVWTCPTLQKGKYLVVTGVTFQGIDTSHNGNVSIVVGGSGGNTTRSYFHTGSPAARQINFSSIVYLYASDTVSVTLTVSGSAKTVDVLYGSSNTYVQIIPLIGSY